MGGLLRRRRDGLTRLALALGDLLVALVGLGLVAAVEPSPAGRLFGPGGSGWWWAASAGALGAGLALGGGYRVPQAWTAAERGALGLRTALLLGPGAALLALGPVVALGWAPPRAAPGLLTLLWAALLGGAVTVRWLAGRLQLVLGRWPATARRALVLGGPAATSRLVERLGRHPWLAEQVVGRVGVAGGPEALETLDGLEAIVAREAVDVLWLAPEVEDVDALLRPLAGGRLATLPWRVLPEDYERVVAPVLAAWPAGLRRRVLRRLRRHLALPTVRVAMLGSRGVPARYSGVERAVEEIGASLAAAGAEVTVYCHRAYVPARGVYRGMSLRFVPAVRTRHLETWSHTLLATLDVLLRPVEVVHYHALGPATFAWLPRLVGRKVVVTVQGLDWQRAKWGPLARAYLRLGEWASARLPHRTVVVSRTLEAHYRARWGRSPVYLPNGFTRPRSPQGGRLRELGLVPGGYVLFVGRLVPEKACHTLLAAWARVRTERVLAVAGAAAYESAYVRALHEAARGLPVRFLGFVAPDLLEELYAQAYLVVHPSELEGLSVVLLEALSHGACVVASDLPENREVLGEAGSTVPRGDVRALADRLQWFLDHPEAVETMRARARVRATELWDWSAVGRATLALYEELLAPGTGEKIAPDVARAPARR